MKQKSLTYLVQVLLPDTGTVRGATWFFMGLVSPRPEMCELVAIFMSFLKTDTSWSW